MRNRSANTDIEGFFIRIVTYRIFGNQIYPEPEESWNLDPSINMFLVYFSEISNLLRLLLQLSSTTSLSSSEATFNSLVLKKAAFSWNMKDVLITGLIALLGSASATFPDCANGPVFQTIPLK